jgi:hypothetical protein
MYAWTTAALDTDDCAAEVSASGAADTHAQAWADAIDATIAGIAGGEFARCCLEVEGHPILLDLGRTDDGEVDLVGTRAALERTTAAVMGVPI